MQTLTLNAVNGTYTSSDVTVSGTNTSETHKVYVAFTQLTAGKIAIQYKLENRSWSSLGFVDLSGTEVAEFEFSGVNTDYRFVVSGVSGTGKIQITDSSTEEDIHPLSFYGETNGMTPEEIGQAITYDDAIRAIRKSVDEAYSGPMSGYAFTTSGATIGVTGNVKHYGVQYDMTKSGIAVAAGDTHVYYDPVNGVECYDSEQENKTLIALLGYVFNPYEPERHGTIEGIPSDWGSKTEGKNSYIWKMPPIDDYDARVAHYEFHNKIVKFPWPNAGEVGYSGPYNETITSRFVFSSLENKSKFLVSNQAIEIADGFTHAVIQDFTVNVPSQVYAITIKSGNDATGPVSFERFTCTGSSAAVINTLKTPSVFRLFDLNNFDSDGVKPTNGSIYELFEISFGGLSIGSHTDCFQFSGGNSDVSIKGGVFWVPSKQSINSYDNLGSSNACIFAAANFGAGGGAVEIENLSINDCLINGGGYSVYIINETEEGLAQNIEVRNCWFGLDYSFDFAKDRNDLQVYQNPGDGISVWENNRRIDSGELIPKPAS